MKNRLMLPRSAIAWFFLAGVVSGSTLHAEPPAPINIPGHEFALEYERNVEVKDEPGGRQFHGKAAFADVVLRASLPKLRSNSGKILAQRLVVHFRTSEVGPSLRFVELRDGPITAFHAPTLLKGDYTNKETVRPDDLANVWDLRRRTRPISSQPIVRLGLTFPGGIDSAIDAGDFFLKNVVLDVLRETKRR